MMTKAFMVTHGNLGREMLTVAEKIMEIDSGIECIGFDWKTNGDKALRRLEELLKQNRDHNVIMFTDMFGGAPSNICSKYHGKNVEVITGINLPGLLKYLTHKDKKSTLKTLLKEIKKEAIDGINIIGEYLGEKRS